MKMIPVLMAFFFFLTACGAKEGSENPVIAKKRIPQVQTVKVKPQTTVFSRSFLVTLEPWKQTAIVSKATGYITNIIADNGDFVNSGSKLAVVEPDELLDQKTGTEAALEAAQSNYENAKKNMERSENLIEKGFISQAEADLTKTAYINAQAQLKAAQTNLKITDRKATYSEITAPYSGYIISRDIEQGTFVSPQSGPVYTIGSIEKIKAHAAVSQNDIRFFISGRKVALVIDGMQEEPFEGKVKKFSTTLNLSTRTLDIEMEFDNSKKLLKPGMFGRITIIDEDKKPVIILDPRAIIRKGDSISVYTVENSKVKEVKIQLGRILPDGKAEITSGISEGTEVIVIGRDIVRNGIEVSPVPYIELEQQ
ncbi:MAG TPA: efflux RND transporter periplasmic adaptor subunit [bacterium]|nr:efflux RND transporter periplasmic adaptor subunit [bacterium]HPS30553.1 efflux RND transporter periplasmic adaptor subunit [bacterium]